MQHEAAAADGKSSQSIFNDKLAFKIGFKAIKFWKSIQKIPSRAHQIHISDFQKAPIRVKCLNLIRRYNQWREEKQQTITAYLFCAITRFHGLIRVHCKKLRSVRQARTYIYVPIQVSKWKYLFKHQVFVFFPFCLIKLGADCDAFIYIYVLLNTQ